MNKETYTKSDVETLLKAFMLDITRGRVSKELLEFCNKWIKQNMGQEDEFSVLISPIEVTSFSDEGLKNMASALLFRITGKKAEENDIDFKNLLHGLQLASGKVNI